ncbi:TIGR01619 family protein [Pontibacter indicus]|uniref:TIGR01619 family protein n=2 Tax=Pontibacter indicus TaxID=1317125 RepID=A0A1R3WFM5_9BACT|nr:TIGR01619 family protein [Pontibacter indicus]
MLSYFFQIIPMTIPAHTPEWEVYFCDINERPACVSVDLAYEHEAPIPEKDRAFELVVALQQADADGFPADEAEWEQLEAIEEALVDEFQNSLQAAFVGKLLHDGKRSFYFYSAQEALPEVIAANIMQQFPAYTYSTNTLHDPDWGLYLDFLFPEPVDMQSIKNSRILRMMEEQGDEHHIPRSVSHFISFATEDKRADFKRAAEAAGYTLVQEGKNQNESDVPYSIVLSKVQAVTEEDIHNVTLELWQMAEEFEGAYGGWQAQVVREND